MEIKYTKKLIEELRNTKLCFDEDAMYLHCKSCIPSKVPDGQAPKDFGKYYSMVSPLRLSGGITISVVSIWCGHCNKRVWDSRHLKHAY